MGKRCEKDAYFTGRSIGVGLNETVSCRRASALHGHGWLRDVGMGQLAVSIAADAAEKPFEKGTKHFQTKQLHSEHAFDNMFEGGTKAARGQKSQPDEPRATETTPRRCCRWRPQRVSTSAARRATCSSAFAGALERFQRPAAMILQQQLSYEIKNADVSCAKESRRWHQMRR